ncbi:Flavonoid 3'-monooxygenase CYP75B137 [Linum grandiflorum]
MSLSAAMIILSTFVLSTTLYILIIFRRRRNPTPPPPPPGPRGLPIVGYLPFLTPNLHQLFMQMSLDYGPIFKLSVGRKLLVVVSSPTLAKEILRDHDVTFANRNPSVAARTFSYGGKDIAFSPYGPEWRMLRKVFVQNMQSRKVLEASYLMRKDVLRKTVKELYRGGRIDVGQVAFTIVIGMISRMFWGETLDGDDHVVGKEFRSTAAKLVEVLGRPNVSDFFPVLARFDLQEIEKEMKKVSGGMEKIFDFVIDRCIEKKKKKSRLVAEDDGQRQDFLHFLLELRDDDTGTPISRQQIKAMFMDIVVGGTDTSSTTIEWVMSELILNPESMKRVQHELTEVIKPDSVVEESDISNLPFLHAVVKETLRLHPVAPLLLPRSPTESCHVGGYTIPEGAKVFLNVWAMHRDPDYWTNPSSFCPGRFVNEGLDYMGNNFHYLPFGSGRRFCAGFQLGEKMVMYVLATFLHMFDWEVPEDVVADTEEKFGVVLEKVTPLILIPSPRLSNPNFYCS